jgi:two-component system, NtrC family, response regulator AtoC
MNDSRWDKASGSPEAVTGGQASYPRLIGNSAEIKRIHELVKAFAPYDRTVLICGPSGSGKEPIAKMLHEKSPRCTGPFVPLNCAAIPETLFESQLFGVREKAVTGVAQHCGFIAEAEGGTIFFDEVDKLSKVTQGKLLRFAQEKTYYPIGSTKPVTANVRIVAATNRDLPDAIRADEFLRDLYYRLNQFVIRAPALNEHMQDLPQMVLGIIERNRAMLGKDIQGVSGDAMRLLQDYRFSGNVRELENFIIEAMVIEKTRIIQADSLREEVRLYAPSDDDLSPADSLSPKDAARRRLALNGLERCDWDVSKASRLIGVDRKTLRGWRNRFHLTRQRNNH